MFATASTLLKRAAAEGDRQEQEPPEAAAPKRNRTDATGCKDLGLQDAEDAAAAPASEVASGAMVPVPPPAEANHQSARGSLSLPLPPSRGEGLPGGEERKKKARSPQMKWDALDTTFHSIAAFNTYCGERWRGEFRSNKKLQVLRVSDEGEYYRKKSSFVRTLFERAKSECRFSRNVNVAVYSAKLDLQGVVGPPGKAGEGAGEGGSGLSVAAAKPGPRRLLPGKKQEPAGAEVRDETAVVAAGAFRDAPPALDAEEEKAKALLRKKSGRDGTKLHLEFASRVTGENMLLSGDHVVGGALGVGDADARFFSWRKSKRSEKKAKKQREKAAKEAAKDPRKVKKKQAKRKAKEEKTFANTLSAVEKALKNTEKEFHPGQELLPNPMFATAGGKDGFVAVGPVPVPGSGRDETAAPASPLPLCDLQLEEEDKPAGMNMMKMKTASPPAPPPNEKFPETSELVLFDGRDKKDEQEQPQPNKAAITTCSLFPALASAGPLDVTSTADGHSMDGRSVSREMLLDMIEGLALVSLHRLKNGTLPWLSLLKMDRSSSASEENKGSTSAADDVRGLHADLVVEKWLDDLLKRTNACHNLESPAHEDFSQASSCSSGSCDVGHHDHDRPEEDAHIVSSALFASHDPAHFAHSGWYAETVAQNDNFNKMAAPRGLPATTTTRAARNAVGKLGEQQDHVDQQSGLPMTIPGTTTTSDNTASAQRVVQVTEANLNPSLLRVARIFATLNLIHEMLLQNRVCTQRELFYRLKSADLRTGLFTEQTQMNKTIEDVVLLLRSPRAAFGVVTSENKGLLATRLVGVTFDGVQYPVLRVRGLPVGEDMLKKDIDLNLVANMGLKAVLVVEKETVFFSLLESSSSEGGAEGAAAAGSGGTGSEVGTGSLGSGRKSLLDNVVMVTAKGYPDVVTRKLLRKLEAQYPLLPFLYLGDCDPHGLHIYLTYKKTLPNLKSIGVHTSDILGDTKHLYPGMPLTAKERKMLRAMETENNYVLENDRLRKEVVAMRECGWKYEVEALQSRRTTSSSGGAASFCGGGGGEEDGGGGGEDGSGQEGSNKNYFVDEFVPGKINDPRTWI